MAVSGSTNFSVNRDEVCKGALRLIGVIDPTETPSAEEIRDCSEALNMMVKALAGEGVQMFTQKRATLFLQNDKTSYSLGLTGDHATHSYNSTTIRLDEVAGHSSLEVTTTTGMAAADYIGIILDSGDVHWTTVSSVTDSDTVVVSSALPSAASAGNNVYWYTSKITRPLRIVHAFIRVSSDDYPLTSLDRDEYWAMPRKTWSSRPSSFYYDNTHPDGTFYTNYQATDLTETLEIVYHRPMDDFDTATDTPDVPQEWYEMLKYGLAIRVAPEYGMESKIKHLIPFYMEAKSLALNVTANSPRSVNPTRF